MAKQFRVTFARALAGAAALAIAAATTAVAQDARPAQEPQQAPAGTPNSTSALNLPQNPQLFGSAMPAVVKATAIVNGDIITQTDIDQRVALTVLGNEGKVSPDQIEQLRQQVLRNLIDETLEIQAAKEDKIEVKEKDIQKTILRVAGQVKKTPDQLAAYLAANGSSIKSLHRQIEGEISWQRLQADKIDDSVSVGDDEVKAVLARMNASKGTEEYRVGEIFLAATPETMPQAQATAQNILDQLKNGASFQAYARQYSVASTAAVGGDLGWVRTEQLPQQLAAVLQQMGPGTISNPIPVPGGLSILAVQDTRKILTADPRDAILSLKQISINFPKGTTREAAEPVLARFADAAHNVGGCGGADKLAADFHGEMVQSDQIKMRDLPPVLQDIMIPMQVGQATQPLGNIDEGVRVLVICGSEDTDATAPSYDQIYNQMNEDRVNSRAQRYLRDLRRDAIIDFR